MSGAPFTLENLAPATDDSARTLYLKIARLLYDNATGSRGEPPQIDDSAKDSLRRICGMLYAASQGDLTFTQP